MKEVKNMLGSSKMYYRVISIHSEPTAGVLSIKFSSAISLKTSLSMISRASLYPVAIFSILSSGILSMVLPFRKPFHRKEGSTPPFCIAAPKGYHAVVFQIFQLDNYPHDIFRLLFRSRAPFPVSFPPSQSRHRKLLLGSLSLA